MYRAELRADPNVPGLLVCKDCTDVYDPYRLPQRQPEILVPDRPSLDASLTSAEDTDIQTQGSQDITTGDDVSLEE
jgi:hypothetical protein